MSKLSTELKEHILSKILDKIDKRIINVFNEIFDNQSMLDIIMKNVIMDHKHLEPKLFNLQPQEFVSS